MDDDGLTNGHIKTVLDDGVTREDYLFRVSIKALIYNENGELLVVKEHGLNWGLPGGGMDFGETFGRALARELEEEVGYTGEFSYDVVGVNDPIYIENLDVYQIWVVCHVVPENLDFSVGVDGEELQFIDPNELLVFDDNQAQWAYRFHADLQDRIARYRDN